MHYVFLFAAIMLEIAATTLLEYSEGFTRLLPAAGSLAVYALCSFCFAKALMGIDLGVAYATWSSVGIVAASIIAAVLFSQRLSVAGILGIVLIIAGCILLNLFGTAR